MRCTSLLAAATALLALAATAGTAPAAVRFEARSELLVDADRASRETAKVGEWRRLSPRAAPFAFDLIGARWRGDGRVQVRWFRRGEGWSDWTELEAEQLADGAEAARAGGWQLGEPRWTGGAVALEIRVRGTIGSLRTAFVRSPPLPRSRRAAIAETPGIIDRSGWGADESIVRAAPTVATRLERAVVHHTAGSLPATPEESARIVRAIQAYHVKSNGWNDIGYNLLVDPFGQVFEGRGGGVDQAVVGAHVRGFNTGSVGIAVLGDYESDLLTPAARDALVRTLAWRLDLAHVDPASLVTAISAGNQRFPAGVPVVLRAVAGHRDMDLTACPGINVYGELDTIAAEVAAYGGPKLFEPAASPETVQQDAAGAVLPVRFSARLSEPLPWTVTVSDGLGLPLASATGIGPTIDWTWDGRSLSGTPTPPGQPLLVTFASDPRVRPAVLALGQAPEPGLRVSDLRVRPTSISPDGDGIGDTTGIQFALPFAATVSMRLLGPDGSHVAELLAATPLPGGPFATTWDGSFAGMPAPDGRYRVEVVADGGSGPVSASASLVVDRTLGVPTASPLVSPNGDGRRDSLRIGFTLAHPADVVVRIRRGSSIVATLQEPRLPAGPQLLSWQPRARRPLPDGPLTVVVRARSDLGTTSRSLAVRVDATPPVLSIVTAWATRRATKVVLELEEAARLSIVSGTRRSTREAAAGRFVIWERLRLDQLRVHARDAAGNRSLPLVIRPGRRAP